jgi:hypothetical protein
MSRTRWPALMWFSSSSPFDMQVTGVAKAFRASSALRRKVRKCSLIRPARVTLIIEHATVLPPRSSSRQQPRSWLGVLVSSGAVLALYNPLSYLRVLSVMLTKLRISCFVQASDRFYRAEPGTQSIRQHGRAHVMFGKNEFLGGRVIHPVDPSGQLHERPNCES